MHLNDLLKVLKKFYDMRNDALKESDLNREKDPTWYKRNDLTGMMMYVNAFAGTLSNLESKLDYIQECNVNYLHLMPLLDSPRDAVTAVMQLLISGRFRKNLEPWMILQH